MNARRLDNGKRAKARQKLAVDLAGITSEISSIPMEENEMLSLIIDEALKGVDIKTRYSDFYRKLLSNAELRQVFLDTLEAIEAGKEGKLVPFPVGEKPDLAFLNKKSSQTGSQQIENEPWQITLQRTIQQLKNIFSPPQLAYRADANLFDDSWFTVLHDEIELGGSSYSILLECGISKETEDALSASLNIAMTLETATHSTGSPIFATLRWGEYSETLTIFEEGRTRFPDIPFSATFDNQNQEITSGLDLVLEIKPPENHAR